MPLSRIQSDILRLLASHRDPESYVAESTPLNVDAARYTEADFRRVASNPPIDPTVTMTRLREVPNEAEAFVMQMPTEKTGLLFLKAGRVVQPDPSRLEDYQTHAGQRRGQWPTSLEISAAMVERYERPPAP